MGPIAKAFDAWMKVKKHHVVDHPDTMTSGSAALVEDDNLDHLMEGSLNVDAKELVEECNRMCGLALLAMMQGVPVEDVIMGMIAEGFAVGIMLERERSGSD